MRVSWQHVLEMKRWALKRRLSFCLSFVPSLLLCIDLALSCCSLRTLKCTSRPLRLCCSWQDFECNMNLLIFCYLNLLKTFSSQHIILSHRYPGLLESAECGPASSDSAAWFTSETCVNTHTHATVATHRPVVHTPEWSTVPSICISLSLLLSFANRVYCFTSLAALSKLN